MRSHFTAVSLVLVLLGMAGCIPEKRVSWAPDGQKAAVLGGDGGLYLCDENGVLSARLAGGVRRVAWFPDSRRLALVQARKMTAWADLAPVLDPDTLQRIGAVGGALHAEMQAYTGDWDEFPARALKDVGGAIAGAALLYVRDRHPDTLSAKLGPEKWAELKNLGIDVYALRVARLDSGTLTLGAPLIRGILEPGAPRVSPQSTAIAYVTPSAEDDDTRVLQVVPADGSAAPRPVASPVALFTDWSADGRDLVYAAAGDGGPVYSDKLRLGVIARRPVCEADGALREAFESQEDLAGIIFQNELRVRCLRDGRVVFAALQVQLPCTTADMPDRAGLFVIDPGRTPGVARLVPRQAAASLPSAVNLFELSPDEQHICVPGADGQIAVLTVATGEIQTLLPGSDAEDLATQPSWRSDTELCFALRGSATGDHARSEIVLCKIEPSSGEAQRRMISQAWPEAVVRGFLQKAPSTSKDAP